MAGRLLLTGWRWLRSEEPRYFDMNIIMLIKTVFMTAILALLVLIGLNNNTPVDFSLPPLLSSVVKQPAAIMYFAFFAVGLLTGAILSIRIRKAQRQA
jgi:uncharacterized integral membrane protein